MHRIKRAFSRQGPTRPEISVRQPDQEYTDMPDGTIILHYQVINVNEILPAGHARIFDDWDKGPIGISWENQYCQLELARFITLPHQKFKPSQEIYDTICRPLPEVKTKDEVADLMKLWSGIFNTWFFANTLSKTKLVVDNFESTTDDALYDPKENLIVIIPNGFEHCKGDYEGTQAAFHIIALLHEMVHAYIAQATCRCKSCIEYSHPSHGGEGVVSGHGPCFLDSFLVVTNILRRVVKWPVPTLASDAVYSMCVDGWQPSRRQLDDWGVRADVYGDPKDWDSERMEVLSQDQNLRNQSELVLKNAVAK